MQIEHLRSFIALSNYKFITKTSHYLNTTPQNVSRILKNLETEMDCDLFIRTNEGVTLTLEGEHFCAFAKSTVYQYDKLHSDIQFKKRERENLQEIVLFSNNVVNEIILNDILTAFYSAYSTILVKNIIVDWKKGYDYLQQTPNAMGFLCYIPEANQLKDFDSTPALSTTPVAIMSKSHPLACHNAISVNDLINHKLILLSQSSITDTEAYYFLNRDALTSNISITNSGNLKSCYQLAANNDFICPGSLESFRRQDSKLCEHLIALPLINFTTTTQALITPKSMTEGSPLHLLYSFILNYLQKPLLT